MRGTQTRGERRGADHRDPELIVAINPVEKALRA
jgi:hypothetical protein